VILFFHFFKKHFKTTKFKGEVFSDLQAYFVELYQNGWYLVPKY